MSATDTPQNEGEDEGERAGGKGIRVNVSQVCLLLPVSRWVLLHAVGASNDSDEGTEELCSAIDSLVSLSFLTKKQPHASPN
jgi:hypothetical protein